ncbi:MAG TPA: hypothetical protein VI233_00045 [Puia sp.]
MTKSIPAAPSSRTIVLMACNDTSTDRLVPNGAIQSLNHGIR